MRECTDLQSTFQFDENNVQDVSQEISFSFVNETKVIVPHQSPSLLPQVFLNSKRSKQKKTKREDNNENTTTLKNVVFSH
jgi:hypothetical protein